MLNRWGKIIGRYLVNASNSQFRHWFHNHRKVLEQYRNRHLGERCFIIGNGPSLNAMDLALMNKCTCFGLNKIYMLFERKGLEIDYHVAVNPLVIQQIAPDYNKINCPSFLSYPSSVDLLNAFNGARFLMSGGNSVAPFTFSPDITQPIHEGCTVTFVAMQIAYFMGFSEVYLVGVDHNFVVDGRPNEKQTMVGRDINHFDPGYFGGKEWHLPDLEASELAYAMANFYYSRNDRKIYDATLGGKLNVFPKITYEEALKRCLE